MVQSARIVANDRIDIVDALRGFALCGIVLAHMVEQYVGTIPPPGFAAEISTGLFDQIVQGLMFLFIVGKFFALFSFLFGLSFYIQMKRASSNGADFRLRFIWRLTILMLIGYMHSLFYRGDILTIYAPLGLLLVLFYNVRSSVLLAIAAVLIMGAGRYLVFAAYAGDTILPFGDADPGLPYNIAYFDAISNGTIWEVFSMNAVYGHLVKMEFQLNYFGRWYLTFAFFLFGLWAGRIGLFVQLDVFRQRVKQTLWWSIAGIVVFLALSGFLFSQVSQDAGAPQFDSWISMFALTAWDLLNVSLTILILSSFVLLFMRPTGGRVLGKLAPYGRTALSNYVMQTVIGTFVLYHWGLGYLGKVTHTQTLLIAVVVLSLQVIISDRWLRRYRYGPLEWLWRSVTYLKFQPMRRSGR